MCINSAQFQGEKSNCHQGFVFRYLQEIIYSVYGRNLLHKFQRNKIQLKKKGYSIFIYSTSLLIEK